MRTSVEKGRPVTITVKGVEYSGTVISALNWGTDMEPNWYVEIQYAKEARPGWGTYGYWKQAYDGGTVVFGGS